MIPTKLAGMSMMYAVMPIGQYLPDLSDIATDTMTSCNLSVRACLALFGADGMKKAWWDALEDPGFHQMKYLKYLMLAFPFL